MHNTSHYEVFPSHCHYPYHKAPAESIFLSVYVEVGVVNCGDLYI